MPWKTCDEVKLRRDFVALAGREGANIRAICRRFGISAPTGYKWLERAREGEGLADRSRRPLSSPGRTPPEMEAKVVAMRDLHPAWGGRKIKRRLEDCGEAGVPSASTITGILRRHGLLGESKATAGNAWQRFERDEPNELWQIDYKGWIPVASGGRCHPLTMLDDHSRYNLLLEACHGETFVELRPLLERAFTIHGLPQALLADNGPPWGDSLGHYTSCEAWLLRLGVKVLHGRPCHPQTQGKEERFHRTLKAEVLSRTTCWRDLAHCQKSFEQWREIYNHERPHEALDGSVPASRYRESQRIMPARLPEANEWYGGGDIVRKVKSKGEITFRNVFWNIGVAFRGQEVALRQIGEQRWEVYFCWKKIGVVDFEQRAGKAKGRYEQLTERRVGRRGSVNDVPEQV